MVEAEGAVEECRLEQFAGESSDVRAGRMLLEGASRSILDAEIRFTVTGRRDS